MSSTPDFDEDKSITRKEKYHNVSIDESVGLISLARIFDKTEPFLIPRIYALFCKKYSFYFSKIDVESIKSDEIKTLKKFTQKLFEIQPILLTGNGNSNEYLECVEILLFLKVIEKHSEVINVSEIEKFRENILAHFVKEIEFTKMKSFYNLIIQMEETKSESRINKKYEEEIYKVCYERTIKEAQNELQVIVHFLRLYHIYLENLSNDRPRDMYILMGQKVQKYAKYFSLSKTLALLNEKIAVFQNEKENSSPEEFSVFTQTFIKVLERMNQICEEEEEAEYKEGLKSIQKLIEKLQTGENENLDDLFLKLTLDLNIIKKLEKTAAEVQKLKEKERLSNSEKKEILTEIGGEDENEEYEDFQEEVLQKTKKSKLNIL